MLRLSDYDNFKDFVFYTILKEKDNNGNAFTFGVEVGWEYKHYVKFSHFLARAADYGKLKNIDKSGNWFSVCERIAEDGNIMLVNDVLEETTERPYLCMLPSFPTKEQLEVLEFHIGELEEILFAVGVYGEMRELFLQNKKEKGDNFDPVEYLKNYIDFHNERLKDDMKETDCYKQKIKNSKEKVGI